jgi:osmotically inducible protein OsmC
VLTVRGTVSGLDADAFQQAADDAVANCPVSKALTGIPDITLDAQLAS